MVLLYIGRPSLVAIQWSPSIAATIGEWHFGCYTDVAIVEGVLGMKH